MSDQEVLVFEVSQASFNTSVILNSHKIPVVVEFMGSWSAPCNHMADDLAGLAKEFAGDFIFAKVDIDEQPELTKEYDVKNVPSVKIFKDGEIVRSEEGQMTAVELRAMLKDYGIYKQSDELREQARTKHIEGQTIEAITLLTRAIKEDPANTRVAMDMVQIFLDIGELDQARGLFNRLPENDKNSETGKSLLGQITIKDLAAKTEGKAVLAEKIANNMADYDARFDLAVCLVAEHDYRAALDQLFTILENEAEYKDGAARELIISLSTRLADNDPELAQEARRRLGSSLS